MNTYYTLKTYKNGTISKFDSFNKIDDLTEGYIYYNDILIMSYRHNFVNRLIHNRKDHKIFDITQVYPILVKEYVTPSYFNHAVSEVCRILGLKTQFYSLLYYKPNINNHIDYLKRKVVGLHLDKLYNRKYWLFLDGDENNYEDNINFDNYSIDLEPYIFQQNYVGAELYRLLTHRNLDDNIFLHYLLRVKYNSNTFSKAYKVSPTERICNIVNDFLDSSYSPSTIKHYRKMNLINENYLLEVKYGARECIF